jgi:hypothetical protein
MVRLFYPWYTDIYTNQTFRTMESVVGALCPRTQFNLISARPVKSVCCRKEEVLKNTRMYLSKEYPAHHHCCFRHGRCSCSFGTQACHRSILVSKSYVGSLDLWATNWKLSNPSQFECGCVWQQIFYLVASSRRKPYCIWANLGFWKHLFIVRALEMSLKIAGVERAVQAV